MKFKTKLIFLFDDNVDVNVEECLLNGIVGGAAGQCVCFVAICQLL